MSVSSYKKRCGPLRQPSPLARQLWHGEEMGAAATTAVAAQALESEQELA